jgi:hypothetical protein
MGLPIDNNICPPVVTDPEDPNLPAFTAICQATCADECPGGTGGTICGETEPLLDPMMMPTIFATICACLCPPQKCAPTQPTTPPTTAMTVTAHVIQTQLALIRLTISTKLIAMLKKALLLAWFLTKIYFFIVLIILCWKLALSHYVYFGNNQIRYVDQAIGYLNFTLGSILDNEN